MRRSGSEGIPICDFTDFLSGDTERTERFIQGMGGALKNIRFFALERRDIPLDEIDSAYPEAKEFFILDDVDLAPDEELLSAPGGEALYDSKTAGEYLHQRLIEIGVNS
ncbi:MAG: hypothetical protein QGF72_03070 [Candidatus Poseidoniaceae archaeon]|jgi:hypothetical protein|nr:hypothetical protein [Candidatus Poseidoniaceae archaeon]